MWAYWAFPMERIVGELDRAARSRIHPYASLQRSILLREQLHNIPRLWRVEEAEPQASLGRVLRDGEIELHNRQGDWGQPHDADAREATHHLAMRDATPAGSRAV